MNQFRQFRFVLLLVVLTIAAACGETDEVDPASQAEETAPAEATASGDVADAEAFYALGFAVSRNLQEFQLTEAELEQVERGLEDGVMGREPAVDLESYGPRLQELARDRSQQAAMEERSEGEQYLAQAAAAEGARKTESGLVFQPIEEGSGASPDPSDTVLVHYRGTLRNGTVFDSSYERGEPVQFPLDQVIPCWSEGVQQMKVGGKAKLVCPPELAYGDRPKGPIPPGSTLTFEVELVEIVE